MSNLPMDTSSGGFFAMILVSPNPYCPCPSDRSVQPRISDPHLLRWMWGITPCHRRDRRPEDPSKRNQGEQCERGGPDQNAEPRHDCQRRDDGFRSPCKDQDREGGQNDRQVEKYRLADDTPQARSRGLVLVAWDDQRLQRRWVHGDSLRERAKWSSFPHIIRSRAFRSDINPVVRVLPAVDGSLDHRPLL